MQEFSGSSVIVEGELLYTGMPVTLTCFTSSGYITKIEQFSNGTYIFTVLVSNGKHKELYHLNRDDFITLH